MKNTMQIKDKLFYTARDVMYFVIGILDHVNFSRTPRITIYCYHSIAQDGWRFSVTQEEFTKQITFLLKKQKPLKLSDLPDYLNGRKKVTQDSFILTFDDGYENILSVRPFLREKNIFPTAFVLSNPASANYAELETPQKYFLSPQQIIELQQSGWEIGSHSATHADFSALSEHECADEITASKKTLERMLNTSVPYIAYPKGVYTEEVLDAVKEASYEMGFSMDDGYIQEGTPRFTIPRVGVDGTHSMQQFPYLASPLSMYMRKVIKRLL